MRLYGYTTACERSQRTPHGPRRLQAEYEPLLGIGHLTYLDEGNDEMDAAAQKLQSTFSCLGSRIMYTAIHEVSCRP
jgi:hypothetical protein